MQWIDTRQLGPSVSPNKLVRLFVKGGAPDIGNEAEIKVQSELHSILTEIEAKVLLSSILARPVNALFSSNAAHLIDNR